MDGWGRTSCTVIGSAKTFLWTSPSTGTATFSTDGSSFDTAIQVQEASCGSEEYCNDDADLEGGIYTSELEVAVQENAQYMISLGGYGGANGTLSLSVTIAQ